MDTMMKIITPPVTAARMPYSSKNLRPQRKNEHVLNKQATEQTSVISMPWSGYF